MFISFSISVKCFQSLRIIDGSLTIFFKYQHPVSVARLTDPRSIRNTAIWPPVIRSYSKELKKTAIMVAGDPWPGFEPDTVLFKAMLPPR
jgi:hypothetical protein